MTKTPAMPVRYSKQPRVKEPTPKQVKAMRSKHALTQAQAGLLVYVHAETWRHYEQDRTIASARQIPAGLWELFRIKVGDLAHEVYEPFVPAFGRADAPPPVPALFTRPKP